MSGKSTNPQNHTMTTATTHPLNIVIAGCGYLGSELARQLTASGDHVTGIVKSTGDPLDGVSLVTGDITDRESLAAVRDQIAGEIDAVVHCASTRGGDAESYHEVYAVGADNLMAALHPKRMVFTSSTSVYGQTGGEPVDETSATIPLRQTGEILLDAEGIVTGAGGVAVRLAGIYGPRRSVVLKRFFEGVATIDEGVERVINQIHRDDAASAIAHLLRHEVSGVFNVADDSPITQRALYSFLALHFDRPMPPDAPRSIGKRRGWTNKAVSNAKLRASGWRPQYSTFMNAVEYDPHLVPSILAQCAGN